jgi:DNA (cytosine-5)-methyltransferase 1
MRAVELFAGAGGLALGFREADIEFEITVDVCAEAGATYEQNLGTRPIRASIEDVLRMVDTGWRPGELDIVVADPPCSPWSRAGRGRGTEDHRDVLPETVALIAALRPRAYLICNVPGLDDSNHIGALRDLLAPLAAMGYCTADFARLDAANYGVPQHRVRPFWFGHRVGECIWWPRPTHGDPADLDTPSLWAAEQLLPWVTVREALAVLPAEKWGHRKGWQGRPHHRLNTMDRPSRTITSREAGRDEHILTWPWDRPSTTVCAEISKIAPAKKSGGQFGPDAIVLSEEAAALIQGFPRDWRFVGVTKRARWSQIGQALPPALAEAVGQSMSKWFLTTG